MKICHIGIDNYKSIRQLDTTVTEYFTLVGQNNAGKSNILSALGLFFSGTKTFDEDIFFDRDTRNPVCIAVTFAGLTGREQELFSGYVIRDALYARKTYDFGDDGKCRMIPAALKPEATLDFLRDGYEDELNMGRLDELIQKHDLPDYFRQEGRFSKPRYREARKRYLAERPELLDPDNATWQDYPRGFPEVFVGYLPDYYVVPAVRDVTDEEKMTGSALLNQLVSSLTQRIVEHNPRLDKLKQLLGQLREHLTPSDDPDAPDNRFEEVKELEQDLSRLLQEVMPGTSIELEMQPPDPEQLFRLNTRLRIQDGLPTYLEDQGHGLQRTVILALLRVYVATRQEREEIIEQDSGEGTKQKYRKPLILAFEEPELYLHPQAQRALNDALKVLAAEDQVIICTHSPVFVDMGELETLCLVSKPTYEEGTTTRRCDEDIFAVDKSPAERKKQFKMVTEFTPERNEMFFARRVVLVEGSTERLAIPMVAKQLGCFRQDVSIIECGGKFNIDVYVRVLNVFGIPYVVAHDIDPVPDDVEPGTDKHKSCQAAYNCNQSIEQCVDPQIGRIESFDPDFERVCGISRNQIDKLGKPLAAVNFLSDKGRPAPERLKEIVKVVYG